MVVLPPPTSLITTGARVLLGASSPPTFFGCVHPYLALARERFTVRLPALRAAPAPDAALLYAVRFDVADCSADAALLPRLATPYNYTLSIHSSGLTVVAAPGVFGAVYALETLLQLVAANGTAPACEVVDAPALPMRGVMLDTGRRFIPVPFIMTLLDTMVTVKLNVLHLHASDQCRFAVESKLFPNLTASLTGSRAGHYTQGDVAAVVAAAAARGIRVVPEFDVPSHAHGMQALKSAGLQFCSDDVDSDEIFHDPANSTLSVLKGLFGEMAGLFPDELFSIGADETDCEGKCTCASIAALERALVAHVEGALGKTSAGWQELLVETGAASRDTVVQAWWYVSPADVIARGNRALDANHSAFYLTRPPGPYPFGWSSFWSEVGAGVNASSRPLLLGGFMTAWTDLYTDPWECMTPGDPPAGQGGPLFPPSADAPFFRSLGGMMFPRAFVGASAFWGYNASINSQAPDFVGAVWALNDRVAAAGGFTCPTRCDCDLLSACNTPYLPPPPPAAGHVLVTAPCALPLPPAQAFRLQPTGGPSPADPAAVLSTVGAKGALLCAAFPPGSAPDRVFGPLVLAPCTGGAQPPVRFSPRDAEAGDGHLVVLDSLRPPDEPGCLDAGKGLNDSVASSECGAHNGFLLPAQGWAVDDGARRVVSFLGGGCLTAVMPPR